MSPADQAEAVVRFQGASFREYIAKLAVSSSEPMVLLVCERLMWELIDFVQEVHGPLAVKAMLKKADDALQLDVPAPIIYPEPDGPDPLVLALHGLQAASEAQTKAFTNLASIILRRLPDARA